MDQALLLWSGPAEPYLHRCLDGLLSHTRARVRLHHHDSPGLAAMWQARGVDCVPMDPERWEGRRMLHRVELVRERAGQLEAGDRLLVLDADLIIQGDPFGVFPPDADVVYTTRSYHHKFPVNAGVWGVQVNPRSLQFLDFYVEQILRPTWRPFVQFRRRWAADDEGARVWNRLDWWVDQDFLCAVHLAEGQLPFPVRVTDAGWRYNHTWNEKLGIEAALQEFRQRIGDPSYPVLHPKGALKWRLTGEGASRPC